MDRKLNPDALLNQGLKVLRDLLGSGWQVTRRPEPEDTPVSKHRPDVMVEVKAAGDSTYAQMLVDSEARVTPRSVEELLLPKLDLVRQVNTYTNLLVIAPWIAPKTKYLLQKYGISYLDLAGNASLRVERPAIVIHTEGETRDPHASTSPRQKTTLAGPKAGRLARLLTDVAPPYRAGELAKVAQLSLPYVSRLLDTLEEQLLIRRDGRTITEVDWPSLLRARAEELNLLRNNPYVSMLAPNGVEPVLKELRGLWHRGTGQPIAITGSHAARAIAPLAVGGQLMLYVPPDPRIPDDLGEDLGLLRADTGADILFLQAHDKVVFARTRVIEGLAHVALSQLVLDCLSGPGRLPAEGEAVLQHMINHPDEWRASSIQAAQGQFEF